VASLDERVRVALGAERAVLGRRIQSLWDGYGEIRRVTLEGVDIDSAIVKHVAPPVVARGKTSEPALRSHRRKLRSYAVELAFYQRYAARCGTGCRVPRALHLESLDNGWLFVLEDLDAAGLDLRRSRLSQQETTSCLAWLAEFHATFLGEPPLELWKVGTYWHLATRPDELSTLSVESLKQHAQRFDAALNGATFRTFVHGDAKLENFCFARPAAGSSKEGRAAQSSKEDGALVSAVDFQYVGGGAGIKDLAYFLGSCLSASECETNVGRHLDTYFELLERALAARASNADFPALEREWRALFPVAWADFYRFLLGWAKDAYPFDAYSRKLTQQAIAFVTRQR
jgi:hypothetical protein